jgi:hypothetical protein
MVKYCSLETMSSLCVKTLHPAWAFAGYVIITSIVFSGLLSSLTDMFVLFVIPDCAPGTTDTPYQFSISPAGLAVPVGGPQAPDSNSRPFCSSDLIQRAYRTRFTTYGYLAQYVYLSDRFISSSLVTIQPWCTSASNSTCPSFDSTGASSFTASTIPASLLFPAGTFQISDNRNTILAFGNTGAPGLIANLNNVPITFSLVSGGSMPCGVVAGQTYYLRNVNIATRTFNIATAVDQAPLGRFTCSDSTLLRVTLTSLGSCASQQNVQPAPTFPTNPANVNKDGTLKTGSCGICLTQQQQTSVLSVPGLVGFTITLLLILELMICIPFIRKMGFFRIFVIIISVLCIIFLIAALGAAAVTFRQMAECHGATDFSPAQLMPSPTSAPAFAGYQPSTGGASLILASGAGFFSADQPSGRAVGAISFFVPSIGATQLIIAILLLFIFTIFFAVKTDWTASASDHKANDGNHPMAPL